MLSASDQIHLQPNGDFTDGEASDVGPGGGLFLVVKQSTASVGTHSLPSSAIRDQLTTDLEEQVFQRSFLNKELESTKSGDVYEIYKGRIQHTLMVVYLLISAVSNAVPILVCLGFIGNDDKFKAPSGRVHFAVMPVLARFLALLVNGIVFILSLRERLFRKPWSRLLVSTVLIAAGFFAEYASTLYELIATMHDGLRPIDSEGAAPIRIRNSFCFVLGTTIFLPFPRHWQASLAGLILVLIEFAVSLVIYSSHAGRGKFVAAEFVAHVVALFVGCYVRFLMDITNKKSFLDRRNLVKTKCQLDFEAKREEQLMLSIMPKCDTTRKVREDLRDRIIKLRSNPLVQKHGFNELYIQEHSQVTILYADIVNSMQLASALDPSALLETLDQLFATFDDRAEKNSCLRIKFLGDCYYCVSGVPDYQENHADNCVNMALDMIKIIQDVRRKRQVDVDMRIGIHSGAVWSGILGLKRWQFDIWSNDAQIASNMEQSGRQGCVHITQATKDLLKGTYNIQNGYESLDEQFGLSEPLKTYFILPCTSPTPRPSPAVHRGINCVVTNDMNDEDASVPSNSTVIEMNVIAGRGDVSNNNNNSNANLSSKRNSNNSSCSAGSGRDGGSRGENFNRSETLSSLTTKTTRSAKSSCSSSSNSTIVAEQRSTKYLLPPDPSPLRTTLPIDRTGDNYIKKQNSITSTTGIIPATCKRSSSSDVLYPLCKRQTTVLAPTIQHFNSMVQETNKTLEKEIHQMKLSKRDQWLRAEKVHPFFLSFADPELEQLYAEQPDPLFRYYLLCLLIVLIGMSVVHFTVLSYTSTPVWSIVSYVGAYIVLIAANLAAWAGFVWTKFINVELTRFPKELYVRAGHVITHNRRVRLILWLVCSTLIFGLALLGLASMPRPRSEFVAPSKSAQQYPPMPPPANHSSNSTDPFEDSFKQESILPWSYTFSIILSMTAQTVFLRIHFVCKLLLNFCALLTYAIHYDRNNSSDNPLFVSDWPFMNYDDTAIYTFYLLYILCLLHVLDRQIEYMSRIDFDSQKTLQDEKAEVQLVAQTNLVLLENLLPVHVARHYLEPKKCTELYYEQYHSAAVMFASIPNFTEFYRNPPEGSKGSSCLRVLNEVICEFDKLLFQLRFSRVEKLKTVGATYMAATGLEPGRGSNDSSLPPHDSRRQRAEDPKKNVKTMLRFAIAMQQALKEINRHAWQDFRLRVGISIGEVVAGVVGAKKPQYDIWGDTVNMASRMDSTGPAGRIQVTPEVYELIQDDPTFRVQERGEIFVKGKGMVQTYLLCSDHDWPPSTSTQT